MRSFMGKKQEVARETTVTVEGHESADAPEELPHVPHGSPSLLLACFFLSPESVAALASW